VVGSPAYRRPEQWRGERVDGRADQDALGVLACELLTGKRPFATASMQELLRMHLAEDPPDIISFRGDLPAYTTDAVRHAMAKDPADRFVSATAFVDALAGGGPSRASRPRITPPIPADAISGRTTVKHVTPRPSSARPASRPSRAPSNPVPKTAAVSRRPWLVIVLLLLLGAAAGAVVVGRMNESKRAALAVVPPAIVPAASPLADSFAAAQKADADENAKLQQEVTDARNAALAAEHKVELLSRSAAKGVAAAAPSGSNAPQTPPAEAPHAHIVVIARGGTPHIFVDGRPTVNSAPAVVEVPPGKHTVAVRGAPSNPFTPREYTLDLAPNDTQQVVFVSPHAGLNEGRRQRLLQSGDSVRRTKRPPD
jgi:hypothetical protein